MPASGIGAPPPVKARLDELPPPLPSFEPEDPLPEVPPVPVDDALLPVDVKLAVVLVEVLEGIVVDEVLVDEVLASSSASWLSSAATFKPAATSAVVAGAAPY